MDCLPGDVLKLPKVAVPCKDRLSVFDLSADPRLDKIRGDQRFRAVLRRVNLPH
jgi:hypothetical protein